MTCSIVLIAVPVVAFTAWAAPGAAPFAIRSVPRELNGELSGFAINDQDVAQLVANIEDLALFDDVNLDFSRTRSVRGRNAREFRVSFSADLDFRYEVIDPEQTLSAHTGRAHVQ